MSVEIVENKGVEIQDTVIPEQGLFPFELKDIVSALLSAVFLTVATARIQKRIEYYSDKAGLKVSCNQLRHTMATQLLNVDTELSTIQDLLGHRLVTTTLRYCRVCNLKVQRNYHRAMEFIIRRT